MANTIYTLRTENVGTLEHLNGKMFTIELDCDGHMTLNDVTTGDWLRKTTRIVKTEVTMNGVVYTTKSGTVYDLVNVSSILPSNQKTSATFEDKIADLEDKLADLLEILPVDDIELPEPEAKPVEVQEVVAEVAEIPEQTEEIVSIDDIPEVLNETQIERAIYYGDGYDGTVYRFAKEVTYEQFVRFCKANELKLPREEGYAWYEDYPQILSETLLNGARHPMRGASEYDTSFTWTWLWVRAYTD